MNSTPSCCPSRGAGERIDAGGERCHLYRKEDREGVLIFPGDSGVSCLFVFRSLDEAKRFLSSR